MNAHRDRPDRQWREVKVGGAVLVAGVVLLIVLRLFFA